MYRFFATIFLCLSLSVFTKAKGYFEYSPIAIEAYDLTLSLRFEEARTKVLALKKQEPENLIVHHIENYIDFFTVFINEEETEFKRLESNKDKRLEAIENGDKESPYYLYTQAEIKLQWALARLKFEEYFVAFKEVKSAYKLLNKNLALYPEFIASKKSLGILHALIGTVPNHLKWGVKLVSGMGGTIEQGQTEIEAVLEYAKNNDFIFEEETLVMYAFLLLHLNNKTHDAWTIIKSEKLDPATNPLACFVLANMAMRTGRNDKAIQLLENQPKGTQFHSFQYLDYMLGLAKLYRMDEDAKQYLSQYATQFKGRNYIKEAHQKLAWIALLNNDEAGYFKQLDLVKVKGNAVIGGDKNAFKEAKEYRLPTPFLVKARLLFDGGYYQETYDHLNGLSTGFTNKKDQLEYIYRFGRVCHRLKQYSEARIYYQETINQGREESWYFACNAALQMGLIAEAENDFEEAKRYYRLCQDISPSEYKTGLHQQAKAGLNRLKG